MNSIKASARGWLLWLSPFAILLLLLGWETDWGQTLHRAPPGGAAAAPQPVVLSLLPEYQPKVTPETSRDMVDRTLFNPTRRPAPTAVAAAEKSQIKRGQFTLNGTLVVDGKAYAFLRENNGGKARRVAKGETINGMLVVEVKPDRVRLTMGEESEELVLKLAVGPRVTVQPVAVRAGPGAATRSAQAPAPPSASPQRRNVSEVLAERRRAARAAEAAAAGRPPGSPLVAPAAPAGAAMQSSAPGTPTSAAVAPVAPDPQWQSVYQRYQQPRR